MAARRLAAVLALAAGLCAAQPAPDADALRLQLGAIEALRAQRPGDGALVYYHAMTHAALGERDAALALLRGLRGRRLGIVPAFGFDALAGDPAFRALRDELAADEPATPDAPVVHRLPDATLIPEGIAHDARRGRFFVGSIAQRKIVVVDRRGAARDFSHPVDALDAVLGLAVDARRDRLYAISTNALLDAARPRRNAVVAYSLASGRRSARFETPDAAQLNDVAVAPDGTVYASDSAAGALYVLRRGAAAFVRRVEPGRLPGANGVAVADDGTPFVAISTGIARVGPDGAVHRLPQPDSVVTAGIDGLYWHRGALVGVQNLTTPGRVIRIELADAGTRIAGVTVLQSHHHPHFAEPTTGAVAGETLVVIANSQVARHRPDGTLDDPATLAPPVLIAVPLGAPKEPPGRPRVP